MGVFSVTSTSKHRNGLPMFYGFEVAGVQTLDDLASRFREGGLVVGRRWRVRRDDAGLYLIGGTPHAITTAEIAVVQVLRGADGAIRSEE